MPKTVIEIPKFARMWPREIFDAQSRKGRKGRKLAEDMTILQEPGVYILYRDDVPYYIGQATKLIDRLRTHSTPGHRYDLFWNYFSVFVVEDPTARNRIEAILITAFPTANGATPKIKRHPYPKEVVALVRRMRACQIDIASERDSDGTEE